MKKLLALLLVILTLFTSALAEGMAPSKAPITIDGARVAFFDAEGNYLQPMEKDGLLWVPLNALCENLGKTAQVQGQSIMVDGRRVGLFDEAGNFLLPEEVNGQVYVPLAAFMDSLGVSLAQTDGVYAILLEETAAPVEAAPASTPQPLYGYVPLTAANFLDFFTVETGTSYPDINANLSPFTVTYKLTCRATTSYGLENVKFKVNKFGTVTMPASGTVTKTVQDSISRWDYKTDVDYIRGQGAFCTQALLQSFSLEGASGRLRMSYDEAEALKKDYYEKAKGYFELGAYSNAVRWYELLAGIDYLDSKALLKEARSKKAAEDRAAAEAAAKKKEEENQKKYNDAQALLDEGKYDEAAKAFANLKDYKDSAAKAEEAKTAKLELAYADAMKAMEEKRWQDAINQFDKIREYKDSTDRMVACMDAKNQAAYEAAEALEQAGSYAEAYEAFHALGNYKDSPQRVDGVRKAQTYQKAEALIAQCEYDEARQLLEPLSQEEKAQQLIGLCNLRYLGSPAGFNAEGTSWVQIMEKNQKGKTLAVNKVTLMNLQGQLLLPLDAYDALGYGGKGTSYVNRQWSEGLCRVKNAKGLYGYVNAMGETVIPAQYGDAAETFYQGAALVRKVKQWLVIDPKGNTLGALPQKDGREYQAYVGEGLVTFKEKDKIGLINLEGKVVLKPKYTYRIDAFDHGMAVAISWKKNKSSWAVINTQGKEVVKAGKYKSITLLGENLLAVISGKDTQYTLVDLKGKKLSTQKYTKCELSGDLILVEQDGKWGALDKNLNQVVPCQWTGILVGYESQVVGLKTKGLYNLYSIHNLNEPLLEGINDLVRMNPDTPYVTMYDVAQKGWCVYDSEKHITY